MKLKYINWSWDIFPGFYESELYNCDTLYNINENNRDELDEGEYYDFQEPDGYKNFEKSVCEQAVDALFYNLDDAPEITKKKFLELPLKK